MTIVSRFQLIFGRLSLVTLRLHKATPRQEGQALIEYALIVSLIGIIAIASLKLTGTNVSKILNTVAGEV
jgi:Flp pilus assembly pilin Flp